jgi:hypothetical protein
VCGVAKVTSSEHPKAWILAHRECSMKLLRRKTVVLFHLLTRYSQGSASAFFEVVKHQVFYCARTLMIIMDTMALFVLSATTTREDPITLREGSFAHCSSAFERIRLRDYGNKVS